MPQSADRPELNLEIRAAETGDIPEILRQRRAMYEDMNYRAAAALDTMVSLSAGYLLKALTDGSFRGWLALADDRAVGGGAVLVSPWPAHVYDLQCRRATILNVYTYAEYRRRGIARRIMHTIIDWCKREGFARVDLHASDHGRHLYESLGFEPSNEMRLKLR
jgi:GNAT superfamily N-acetyltransferase